MGPRFLKGLRRLRHFHSNDQIKIGSRTPTNAGTTSAPTGAALPCGAARLSASHHGSHQRESSSLRLSVRPGFLGRGLNGRYPPSPVPVQGSTSRPGHNAGGLMPEAAREQGGWPHPRAPHLPHRRKVPSPAASLVSKIRSLCNVKRDKCQVRSIRQSDNIFSRRGPACPGIWSRLSRRDRAGRYDYAFVFRATSLILQYCGIVKRHFTL